MRNQQLIDKLATLPQDYVEEINDYVDFLIFRKTNLKHIKEISRQKTDWQNFIDNTYGSLANDLLVRPEQLPIEDRLDLL
jgi:hypothetical protein